MLFNSFEFAVFFILVTLFFFLFPHRYRWSLLLGASCFFYMFFKPEYILILAFTIVIDYFAGLWIERAVGQQRRLFLIISLIANIGVLAIFKYYNFINDQVTGLAAWLGHSNPIPYLNMILPIGLSFHTFQAMSYTIEVYRGNQAAEKHFGIYSLYVMFYPQLVAGPIERPQNILHQFHEEKKFSFENLFAGLRRISWGLFKKVVIADRLAVMVDYVYDDPYQWQGLSLLLCISLFAIQIYCDFSGYSDIALGAAQVMGYKLMENFNFPFRAQSVTEFWRRWHISLSTWFNDYLFTPLILAKREWGNYIVVLAIFLTFSLSGLWHGAGWTFIIYGMMHGLAVIVELFTKKQRKKLSKKVPAPVYKSISILLTFFFVSISWIFFRAESLKDAVYVLTHLFTAGEHASYFQLSKGPVRGLAAMYLGLPLWQFIASLLLLPFLFLVEYLLSANEGKTHRSWPLYIKWAAYYLIIFSILFFGVFDTKQFIYFQF